MALEQPVPRSKTARFNEIVHILIRHDAWSLMRHIASGRPMPEASDPAPVRVRRILEELGPSFIKIGQLLATRPDLVSQEYADEFKNLYDKTAPTPFSDVRTLIEEELGQPLEAVFASFEPSPIASASVGQVHKATLKDGTTVAVKVQHPAIEEAMLTDFRILRGLVTFIEKTFAASRVWQPTSHLNELEQMLRRELDYGFEARNMERVAESFRSDRSVHIPRVVRQWSAKRVLVMQYVDGIRFKHTSALDGIDKRAVARIVTHAMARQIFIHRFFHADPSPGNILILDSHRVAFLDWGAVGIVTERRAKAILRLITSIAKKDADDVGEAVVDLCEQHGETDAKRFRTDIERILDYFERERVSVADPRMIEMILNLAKDHHMLLPPDFLLITRALFQFDGFCRDLDPDYDLVKVLEPLVGEILWRHSQGEILQETLGELARFARTFPQSVNRLVRRVERNELSTRVEVAGLEGIKRSQGRSALKLSFTVMMAAIVLGLGVVFAGGPDAPVGPFLFTAAAVVAVWSLVLVLWSEGMRR